MAMFDAGVYMDTYADLQKAYNDMRKRGQLQAGTGSYFDAYGKNLSEKNWVDILNKSTGKNLKGDVKRIYCGRICEGALR